jgi:AbrB family transcriptional regulator (stage V sporulation protein T)
MRATGIVRRIDELGRVVIPKEIRRTLRIREGDPLEIFTDHDGEVVLKKYSPIGEIANIAKDYTDSLYRTLGHITCICDRDAVVSATGGPKRELVEKSLSTEVEGILQSRQMSILNASAGAKMIPITADDRADAYSAQLIAPILADGEIIGGLLLLSRESGTDMSEIDQKVAETTTSIIARQMEQ